MKRSLSIYRTLLCCVALFPVVEGCLLNPLQNTETTVFGTVAENTTAIPIDSAEVIIWGMRGSLKPIVEMLQTVYTDKVGHYSITLVVPKEFHSVNIEVYTQNRYKDFLVFLNGRQSRSCCTADKGKSTQYDFMMFPK